MDVRNLKKAEGKGSMGPHRVSGHDDEKVTPEPTDSLLSEETKSIKDVLIQGYFEYASARGISSTDVMTVLDTIITSGSVSWSFKLFDKIPVVLQLRPAWVNNLLMDTLDKDQPKSQASFYNKVSEYNLAGSITKYGETKLPLVVEADFYTNKTFICSLPYIVKQKLVDQMALFDRVVAVATSTWAIENFTEPPSEK